MTDKYVDTSETLEVLESLKMAANLGDVLVIIKKVFPDWVVTFLDDYSDDYTSLRKHWHEICVKSDVKPAQVMIVDEMKFSKSHTLIGTFSEIFTRSGFSVRSKHEIGFCDVCNKAIPSRKVYHAMNDKSDVPDEWSATCRDCFSSNS